MKFSDPYIQSEYERCVAGISGDPYDHDGSLGIIDVINAHFLIADFFHIEGHGIGGLGPKSIDLLHSAMYRQHACFGNVCKYTDKFDKAATLLYGLIKDHPFHDANKRTAFLSILYMLQKFEFKLSVSSKEFEDFLVEVANGEIKNRPRYKKDAEKYDDPEVRYISYYLRHNTSKIDRKQYVITYRQLKTILNRFYFDLKDPNKNSIDVIKYQKKILKNPFSKNLYTEKRIGQIGFPSWTKEVSKNTLKRVRDMTGLTIENGYDSKVFFQGANELDSLIAEYQEPLKRLADR